MRLPLLRSGSFAVTFIMLIGILTFFMSSLHAAEKKWMEEMQQLKIGGQIQTTS